MGPAAGRAGARGAQNSQHLQNKRQKRGFLGLHYDPHCALHPPPPEQWAHPGRLLFKVKDDKNKGLLLSTKILKIQPKTPKK